MSLHAEPIGSFRHRRIPRIDYYLTCDVQLSLALYPLENIGPVHHLLEYPDHVVVSVIGELSVWRGR